MIYAVQRDNFESDSRFGGLVFTCIAEKPWNIAYGYARDLALLSLGMRKMPRHKNKTQYKLPYENAIKAKDTTALKEYMF